MPQYSSQINPQPNGVPAPVPQPVYEPGSGIDPQIIQSIILGGIPFVVDKAVQYEPGWRAKFWGLDDEEDAGATKKAASHLLKHAGWFSKKEPGYITNPNWQDDPRLVKQWLEDARDYFWSENPKYKAADDIWNNMSNHDYYGLLNRYGLDYEDDAAWAKRYKNKPELAAEWRGKVKQLLDQMQKDDPDSLDEEYRKYLMNIGPTNAFTQLSDIIDPAFEGESDYKVSPELQALYDKLSAYHFTDENE